jgi:hypothetical protein
VVLYTLQHTQNTTVILTTPQIANRLNAGEAYADFVVSWLKKVRTSL